MQLLLCVSQPHLLHNYRMSTLSLVSLLDSKIYLVGQLSDSRRQGYDLVPKK